MSKGHGSRPDTLLFRVGQRQIALGHRWHPESAMQMKHRSTPRPRFFPRTRFLLLSRAALNGLGTASPRAFDPPAPAVTNTAFWYRGYRRNRRQQSLENGSTSPGRPRARSVAWRGRKTSQGHDQFLSHRASLRGSVLPMKASNSNYRWIARAKWKRAAGISNGLASH